MSLEAMIKVYVSLIKKGKKTLEDVPETLRAAVQAALNKNNEG